MKKVKKIYKYPTGSTIPHGAIYLSTVTQTKEEIGKGFYPCFYVWHYFLVEVEE